MNERCDDIVITGAGLVTCLGLDRESTWRAVAEGRCGLGPLTAVESPLDPARDGGQVQDPDSESPSDAFESPREVRLLRRALREVLDHAGIDSTWPYPDHRCAVVLGTTLHGMRNGGRFLRTGDPLALRAFLAGATSREAFADLPSIGLTATTCSACSSGLASIALGYTLLQTGEADLVIAGGYDPISEYSYAGFHSMRLVSETTLRPFARTRDGMKVAEGYAVVVIERASDARRRGAAPLVRIAGFGESCDTYHLSKPHPEGAGAMRAMRQALTSAGLVPNDIDMLIAHATGTPNNDASEYAALAQVFRDSLRRIPLVTFKGHLGHSLGAAGTVELILGALAIRDDRVPPLPNRDPLDLEFDHLRYGPDDQPRRKLRRVLSTSLGFGGANVCVVIEAPRESTKPGWPANSSRSPSPQANRDDPVITGVGVVLPGVIGAEAFARGLASNRIPLIDPKGGAIAIEQYEHLLIARRVRRMSDFATLCLAATADAYRDAGIEDLAGFGESCAAIVSTTNGAAGYCETYYRQLITEGVNTANPTLFAEGVPNVASAHLSTNFGITGFCQTLIGTRTAGLEALRLATAKLRSGAWTRAVVCAADEYTETVERSYRVLQGISDGRCAAGAVAFVLEVRSDAIRRGARPRGAIAHAASRHATGSGVRGWVRSIGEVVADLGPTDGFAESLSQTRIGRIEALGLRIANRVMRPATSFRETDARLKSPLEMFSVSPVIPVAAALLRHRSDAIPAVGSSEWIDPRYEVDLQDRPRSVGVVASDYHRSTHGLVVLAYPH